MVHSALAEIWVDDKLAQVMRHLPQFVEPPPTTFLWEAAPNLRSVVFFYGLRQFGDA